MKRTIQVPAGIGDCIWMLQKLIKTGERFNFAIAGGMPQRGKQVFDLLPDISANSWYDPKLRYANVEALNAQRTMQYWKKIKHRKFCLSANQHLEDGKRIEQWLPDLEIRYDLPWNTTVDDRVKAYDIINKGNTNKYIGLFATSYSTARAWNFWDEIGWCNLATRLMHHYEHDVTFVIIGAAWDTDLGAKLVERMDHHRVPYINTIGEPLSVVIEVLRKLDYFIGFPSGLSIINETLFKPGLMFYPSHLEKMMYSWAQPDRIEKGLHKPMLFCEPEVAFEWISKHINL